jgi:hypothetical protein
MKRVAGESSSGASGASADDHLTRRFEVYKLEYQIAAERYENIYKAIWQNFSYMAILAGGILTFGAKALPLFLVGALSITPLLFWFMATYLPMDHYARSARKRAAEIEEVITKDFLGLAPGVDQTEDEKREMRHFRDFGNDDPKVHWGKGSKWPWLHVNQVVTPLGGILVVSLLVLIGLAIFGVSKKPAPQQISVVSDSALHLRIDSPTADSIESRLAAIADRLDRIDAQELKADSALRAILACIRHVSRKQCS